MRTKKGYLKYWATSIQCSLRNGWNLDLVLWARFQYNNATCSDDNDHKMPFTRCLHKILTIKSKRLTTKGLKRAPEYCSTFKSKEQLVATIRVSLELFLQSSKMCMLLHCRNRNPVADFPKPGDSCFLCFKQITSQSRSCLSSQSRQWNKYPLSKLRKQSCWAGLACP